MKAYTWPAVACRYVASRVSRWGASGLLLLLVAGILGTLWQTLAAGWMEYRASLLVTQSMATIAVVGLGLAYRHWQRTAKALAEQARLEKHVAEELRNAKELAETAN